MNAHAKIIGHSACPHDCPSTCALDVELLDDGRIGRVHGAEDNSYTAGVICAKVARYAERIHHPDRLMHPLRRVGPEGLGPVRAHLLGRRARPDRRGHAGGRAPLRPGGRLALLLCRHHGPRHARRHQPPAPRQALLAACTPPICTTLAWTGYIAGTGKLAGPDPREMAKSDLVVIWGTNPVNTQVNVMTHAMRARKERGAKIVAIDIYQQRHHAAGRPGAVPAARHRRRAGLRRHARAVPRRLRQLAVPREVHRLPARAGGAPARRARREWASAITGLSVAEIETFAQDGRHHAARPTSGSATASRARATAPTTCTRRCASRPSPAPGCTRAAAASTTTAPSTTGTRR